ncbi:hypothetical protein QEH59_05475 [Coraliomargarita sp. SDUM461004]|uniref:DUF4815 domain-containing protein n=1 Tax=Thalassobacterium sedimentorum TaxID=3041258 RepID=A0ABU1AI57_9BACT|nr:hypothetical protein [Coraliomargarita sp. SDUM461004]MDQ8193863.1 hypothetical protein [Coraliomargarita sp. SDUM461004]
MAFLLLLLVTLSSLIRVETQAAQKNETIALARLNAMVGLSVALGELQELAGSDQRATGTAELYHNSGANTANGLVSPVDGSRHWVAVWGNSNLSTDATSSPVLLNWLVSGNENVRQNFDVSSGQIGSNVAAAVNYSPSSNITVTANGATVDGERAALLVASGTVGDEADYIAAPIVDLVNTADQPAGGYAFWVGDEGVKGHIALTTGAKILSEPSSSVYGERAAKRVIARQSLVAGGQLLSIEDGGATWSDYALSKTSYRNDLERIENLNGLGLMNNAYETLRKNRWHEITTLSQGLQTNSLNGGLKTDLSLAFEMPDVTFQNTQLMNNSYLGHIYRYSSVLGPKWALFRDYYRLYKRMTNVTSDPLITADLVTPLPAEDPDLGIAYIFSEGRGDPMSTGLTGNETIEGADVTFPKKVRDAIFPEKMKLAPVVAEMKFLISMDSIQASESIVVGGKTVDADRQLRLIFDPIVKLWNPYNVQLKFDAFTIRASHLPIGFRWNVQHEATDGSTVNRDYSWSGEDGFVPFRRLLTHYYGGGYGNFDNWLDSMVFSIGSSSGITLQPGEVKIFSSGSTSPVALQQNIDLQEGYNDQGGYLLDEMHLETDTSTGGASVDSLILANGQSRFTVDLSSEDYSGSGGVAPSGWAHFRVSTYLFQPGRYADRHNVKDTGADYFYNTAYLYNLTRNIPFEQNDGTSTGVARVTFPSSGTALVPDLPSPTSSNRQYLLSIESRLKAEDQADKPVPLAQFSPTAYVHESRGNSLVRDDFRSGPSYTLHYRRINSAFESDVQFNSDNQGYYGASHWLGGATHITFLDIPQAPLTSLGQLQNVDTSIHAVDSLLAMGNSFRSPHLSPNVLAGTVNSEGFVRSWSDRSYLLNRSLWDSAFFSTIAPAETELFTDHVAARDITVVLNDFISGSAPLLNPNLRPITSDSGDAFSALIDKSALRVEAPDRSAAFLAQEGQFNINSVSVEAWKSLLGSTLGQRLETRQASGNLLDDTGAGAHFSRYSLPLGNANLTDEWGGFRRLNSTEVNDLVTEIVDLIQQRGPLITLSDFINREVGSAQGGILEQAIENAGINSAFTATVSATDLSFLPNSNARAAIAGKIAQGASQLLLPGDVLSVIGQRLATRSDTFRIRSYGEVRDPLADPNAPVAKAWVEAIVQRVPDYVNSNTNAAWDNPNGANAQFGRKFILRSVRYLSPEEI